jgi:thioredoxin:protein disulfide reductase
MARRLVAALLFFAASISAAAEAPIPKEIVRLRVESAEVADPNNGLRVKLAAEIAEGWHLQSHQPSEPGLIATVLTIEPPADWQIGAVEHPPGKDETFAFADDRPLNVYDGTVRFAVPMVPPPSFDGADVSFHAKLRYQACDDERCLRPTEVSRDFVVRTDGGRERTTTGTTPASEAATTEEEDDLEAHIAPVEKWLRDFGLITTLLLIAGMGVGLNLTPCVYPLISVTLAFFGGQSDGSRRLLLAVVYALGIAVTFSILGVSAALSGGIFGSALQRPETLVFVAGVMVVLALSAFGLYSLQPPVWLLQKVGGSGAGAAGAFGMGLTMGVVAAPCIGPIVVGLLVTVAQRGDPFFGWLLFFTLALGLGAPYVVLALAAGSLKRLPRSGEWQTWVERLFGCVLLGLAIYYVSPLLPERVAEVAMPAWLVVAGLYLGFIDPSGRRLRPFVALRAAAGVAAVALGVWQLVPGNVPSHAIAWQPFSPATLDRAKTEGKPAVVDFRADWCLPCVEMERTTYVEPLVVERAGRVAMLQADVTELSPEHEELLGRYEVLGVPTTLFIDATGREVRRAVGYIDAEDFVRFLDELATPARASSDRPLG